MRIKWLNRALRDLDAETSNIDRKDDETAENMYGYIRSRVDTLGQFPESGRPGRVHGTRELVLTGTRTVFRIEFVETGSKS